MPHIPPERPATPSGARRPRRTTIGYVYLIKMRDVYKIGCTANWFSRKNAFSGLPFSYKLIVLMRSTNMQVLEKQLHKRFESRRLNGEWFSLNAMDVREIESNPHRVNVPTEHEARRRFEQDRRRDRP